MRKVNLIKLISAVVSVAIIVAIICMVLFIQENEENDVSVYNTESGIMIDTNSLQNMPKGLTFIAASETFSETSVSLTATVLPITAGNKSLDWSIAWAEPDGWTSGKVVVDYVSLNSTDNIATITFKKLFNVKVVVTATSKSNPDVKANCILDCAKRLLSANMTMKCNERVTWNFNSPNPVLPLLSVVTTNANLWNELKGVSTIEYDYAYSEGTIDNEILATDMFLSASDSLINHTTGFTRFNTEQMLSKSEYFSIFSYGVVVEGLCGYSADNNVFNTSKFIELANTLNSVDTEDFTLVVRHIMKYGNYFDTVYKCRFDRTVGPFAVSDVSFDNSNIVL